MSAPAPGESPLPRLRPLGVGEILDVGMKVTWRNARTLMLAVVVVVLPVEILNAIILVSSLPSGTTIEHGSFIRPTIVSPSNEFFGFSRSQLDTYVAGTVVGTVLLVLSTLVAVGACYRAVSAAYMEEPVNWRSSLGYAARRLHSILWVTILVGIIVVIGFVLCVIPGIYFAVAFAVAIPVLMSENVKGFKALGRSRTLVSGSWWRTLGVLFLGLLLIGIISGALSALALGLISSGSSFTTWAVSNAVSDTIARVLTTPFAAAFVTILYFDLRVRKEGYDLQLLASRVGVEPPEGWQPTAPVPTGSTPPYWPPPPGWKPGPAPMGFPPPFEPEDKPPFWPPPPGWQPKPPDPAE